MKKTIAGLLVCLTAAIACGDADELFKQGAAVFKSDPAQAYSLFVQAAEGGNVSAMVGAGHCLENGVGTEAVYAIAIEWYEKAAAQKNLKACEGLARIHASCPDPQFHDGEKAVQYAEAVVRNKPKDVEALSLLAAAHARNFEFEKAVSNAKQATLLEHNDEAKSLLRLRVEGYEQGRPDPAMATEAWMVAATGSGKSIWAADRSLWRFCERGGPYYNPEKAIEICHMMIDSGRRGVSREMGGLYVDVGEVGKAQKCLERLADYYKDHDIRERGRELRVLYCLSPKISNDRVRKQAEEYETGFDLNRRVSCPDRGERCSGCSSCKRDTIIFPPDLAVSYFLFRVLVQRGDSEASAKVAAYEQKMGAYRAILANEPNLSNEEVARAVAEEARKIEEGKELPRSILMAIGLYWEACVLDPSPEYETAIERLVETLSL